MLCAAGYNIRWLLRMIAKKGITFLRSIFLCLKQASSRWLPWLASVMAQILRTAKSWISARHAPDMRRWPGVDVLAAA